MGISASGLRCGLVVSGLSLLAAVMPPATAQSPSGHERNQIAALQQIQVLVTGGQADKAAALVEAADAAASGLPAREPKSIDAAELHLAQLAAAGDYAAAWQRSQTVVRARLAAKPHEPLLLGWTLMQHAILADQVGDARASEQALNEAIAETTNVYPAGDVRRPQLLEAYAGFMDSFFHRPFAAIKLYEEALSLRGLSPGQEQDAAFTARTIGTLESSQGLFADADRHLLQAEQILSQKLIGLSDPAQRADLESDLALGFALRAKVAARSGRFDDAAKLLESAKLFGSATSLAGVIEVASSDIERQAREADGDAQGALASAGQSLAILRRLNMDPAKIAEYQLTQARLQLQLGQFDAAEATLTGALKTFNDAPTSQGPQIAEGWLLQARIERVRGKAVQADQLVNGAMILLKSRRSEVPVLFGTNRAQLDLEAGTFGSIASSQTTFGQATILVPGAIAASDVKLDLMAPPTQLDRLLATNIKVLNLQQLQEAATARIAVARLYPDSALIFVHGFGSTFESALNRAGQISRDIAFDGPVFAFSWPAQGNQQFGAYRLDQKAALASVDALVSFIATVAKTTNAKHIHIVAHSMGNLALLEALLSIQKAGGATAGLAGRLGEIVFASPDVDRADFKAKIAQLAGLKMTLYASANDGALVLSAAINGGGRAGSVTWGITTRGNPVTAAGLDSIDVSDAGSEWFGNHELYVSNSYIANDLRKLLQSDLRPPGSRSKALQLQGEPERFWVFLAKALNGASMAK